MDVCIKKSLVATCSPDKSVKIWSYTPSTGLKLDINKVFDDDALSVAFHPSGFHIVVGFNEKIKLMNVFQDDLIPFADIGIKKCREIVFSHGGHLFACHNTNNIQVYRFYTAECPVQYNFRAHNGVIRSISWLDDDSGFVSSSVDADVIMWQLNLKPEEKRERTEEK